jgi:hypothetical protein
LMPAGFVKIYGTILDSSVWSEDPYTRLVWITMLAMADANGFVEASVPGLARRANVPLDTCEKALGVLSSPDGYSKSPAHEGRRVEKVERGWAILNYRTYRDLRTPEQVATAERQAKFKARRRSVTGNASNAPETAALPLPSASTSTEGVQGEGVPSRAEERSEAAACQATCAEYMALTGKQLDEVLWEFSEFKGRRIVRLDTPSSLPWLRVTHDRIRAALIEARREKAGASQPRGEDPLARINRIERERAARLEGKAS